MGLLMKLPKEDNALYTDFDQAYWSIEDIMFANGNGEAYVEFGFYAYPSRESKARNMEPLPTPSFAFGGATGIAFSTRLYQWQETVGVAQLFPDGIPLSESAQKDVLYSYVKERCGLVDYTDVLEDGQAPQSVGGGSLARDILPLCA